MSYEEIINELVSSIIDQKCILFLGSYCSREKVGGQEEVLTEILARELMQRLSHEGDPPHNIPNPEKCNPYLLARVAERYRAQEGPGNNALLNAVKKFYRERKDKNSAVHSRLASLPFPLIVNLTHDSYMYNALKKEEPPKTPKVGFYNFQRSQSVGYPVGTEREPFLFYLFGKIDGPRENAESLVLSETDRLNFLLSVVKNIDSLPQRIVVDELKKEDKIFLFLGFDYNYWHMRILFHALGITGKKVSQSFALDQFKEKECKVCGKRIEDDYITLYFQEGYRIQFIDLDLDDFIDKLCTEYKNRTKGPIPPPKPESPEPQPSSDRPPTVFICHDHQNREEAIQLYNQLSSKGYTPWLDREDIHGGAKWAELIEEKIREIDCFVVLHTRELATRVEGYVITEIKLAIQKELGISKGVNFIIPYLLDSTISLREELRKFQPVENLEGLTKAIEINKKCRRQIERGES
jgi:hypothetical protein